MNQVSDQLGLIAYKYILGANFYFNAIEKATWHFEQPLSHPNTIGIYLLSQEARKQVTVLLSGKGADEALAGYGWFLQLVENPYMSKNFLSKIWQNKSTLFPFLRYHILKNHRMIMGSAFGTINTAKSVYQDFDFQSALSKRLEVIQSLSGDFLLKYRKYEMLTYLPDLLMRQDDGTQY